jgi:hypothetical protein
MMNYPWFRETTFKLLTVSAVMCAVSSVATADVNQPTAIINRPGVLPMRQAEGRLDVLVNSTPTSSITGLRLGFGYGAGPNLELRFDYGFNLSPSSNGKGPFHFGLGYSLSDTGAFRAALSFAVGYDVGPGQLTPLEIGIDAQFKLTPRAALFTPGKQLRIGLAGTTKPVGFDLPIGLRYQANGNLFTEFSTNIAHVGIKDDKSAAFGADFLPIGVGLVYSISNTADIGVGIKDELKNAGDTFALDAFFRLFI